MHPAKIHRLATGRTTYRAQIARRNGRWARHGWQVRREAELHAEGLPNRATRRIGIERKKEDAA